MSLAKEVGLDELELEDVQELVDSHKELLPQVLLELEREKECYKAEKTKEVDVA